MLNIAVSFVAGMAFMLASLVFLGRMVRRIAPMDPDKIKLSEKIVTKTEKAE